MSKSSEPRSLKNEDRQAVSIEAASLPVEPTSTVSLKRPVIFLLVDTPRADQSFQRGDIIHVSGWVAANERIVDIAIEIGGVRRKANRGVRRPDLVAAFPNAPALEHAGFVATIVAEATEEADNRTVQLKVTVTTISGLSKIEVVPVTIAIKERTSLRVHDGEAMKLMVDKAIVTRSGVLRVSGWAVCLAHLESVSLALDEHPIGLAEHSLERKDVAEAWPQYPNALNSGFKLHADVSDFAGSRTLIIKARATTGISREIRLPLEIMAPSVLHGLEETHRLECDSAILTTAGQLILKGWAASSEQIEYVSVWLDDEFRGQVERGFDRPDVGNRFPNLPQARRSGFVFSTSVAPTRLEAEHIVCLTMTLKDGSVREFKLAVAPQQTEIAGETAVGADDHTIMLHIDVPAITDGKAIKDITSGLSISGWALARDGIERIDILLDGNLVGRAYCGMRRKDIAQAFPDWENALLSGFGFSLPRKALTPGERKVTVHAFGKSLSNARAEFRINVGTADDQEGPWSVRSKLSLVEARLHQHLIDKFEACPEFRIAIRYSGASLGELTSTIRSISAQSYTSWSATISCPTDLKAKIKENIAEKFAEHRQRIEITSASQLFEKNSDAVWYVVLEAGDRLAADALFEFASEINRKARCDFVYGDDRRHRADETTPEAFFKPDWSPDLLLSQNYIGRAFCVRGSLFRQCESNRAELFDYYGLVLQCTELAVEIAHVKSIICEHTSCLRSKLDLTALKRTAKRRKLDVVVERGLTKSTYRLRPRDKFRELISIIIPTCAAEGLIEKCLNTIKDQSTYKHVEIICIDNIIDPTSSWKSWLRHNADVVVEITGPFNWSRFNNIAAQEASGSLLLFLNDDIEITQPDWLEILIAIAERKDVGVVGPRLLYPDGNVQHAGLFLAKLGLARHAFRFFAADDPGYFDLALSQRNVIAVTGACMMVRRDTFEKLGGFDESHTIINNDLDFCLRCHQAGLWNVYTPFATLIHHEQASRAVMKDIHDSGGFNQNWELIFSAGDPFFHPNLNHDSDGYEHEAEPATVSFAGRPLFRSQTVKRVLAVKVDHIGDFITAFPAFRRIKQIFPEATLHVLAAPASIRLAFLEPSIDHIIPFEFFHARSSLGQHDTTEEKLAVLRGELGLHEFDIAIDLRKHVETRSLLKCAGAKWTAGFDYQNQFPWLDIALQWEGDPTLVAKRQHIADDLINLVDAVGAAGLPEGVLTKRSGDWLRGQLSLVTRLSENGLFDRRVVCVHPAAGADLKQWLPAHFASLINLLTEHEDVNVALVGGADEVELSEQLLELIRIPERAFSLVGKLKLDELPFFIESCALFVGNDSGPKHLAAALGVPTIGIQSGIVDANEWGLTGELAITIKREVSCAPCYLSKREDCHREVACLSGLEPAHVLSACRRLLGAGRGIMIARGAVVSAS